MPNDSFYNENQLEIDNKIERELDLENEIEYRNKEGKEKREKSVRWEDANGLNKQGVNVKKSTQEIQHGKSTHKTKAGAKGKKKEIDAFTLSSFVKV